MWQHPLCEPPTSIRLLVFPPPAFDVMPQYGRLRIFIARYLYTVPRLAYAVTAGLPSRANRTLLWQIAGELGFVECAPTLPVVAPTSIVDESLPVILRQADAVSGNVSTRELVFLAQLVRAREARRIFEIGTFDGRTTLALAANAPDDAMVHTLDLPAGAATAMRIATRERVFVEKPVSGSRVHSTEVAGKVRQLFGDSATFDFGPYPSELVFVDGSHEYEYVVSDSLNAMKMLGDRGGDIVWHDYSVWGGVTQALNELQRSDPRFSGLRQVAGTTLAVLSRPVDNYR